MGSAWGVHGFTFLISIIIYLHHRFFVPPVPSQWVIDYRATLGKYAGMTGRENVWGDVEELHW